MNARRVAAVLLVLAATAGVLLMALGRSPDRRPAGPQAHVTVSPAPGAQSASPGSQISFRGLPADRLGRIELSGSRSGRHGGTLRAHSDDRGASFVPDEPFEPGEQVTVRTDLTISGARAGDLSFAVARRAPEPKPRVEHRTGGSVQRFRSRPDLEPPDITLTTSSGRASPEHVFLAPKRGTGQDGPMIVDGRGKLVWARPAPRGEQAMDFRVQRYRGRPVLTWWEGITNVGVGFGEGVMLDQSYREIKRVSAGNGYRADLHEFLLTPQGTALLIIYAFVRRDLTEVGGPRDGVVIDGVVQEVDLETGLVLFEWHSLDHVGLHESRRAVPKQPGATFDYVHLNSVGLDDDGDLLVSARHTWAIYKINRRTGALRWRLGGTDSDFRLGHGAMFAFQHDARRRRDGAITLFDNAAGPPRTRRESRALVLDVNMHAMTVRVARQYEHPSKLLSDSQGSAQQLPNGNVFVGWGSQPAFSEFSENGRLLLDGQLAKGNDNYRAYRAQWTGRPATAPSVVAKKAQGTARIRVFASWNGATDVARWELLAGPRPDDLRRVGAASRDGFETAITGPSSGRYVAVRALSKAGHVLGVSKTIETSAERARTAREP